MKFLLLALALLAPVSSASAADQEELEVAYARCVMQSFERSITDKEANEIYVMACMRVAGFVHESGGLQGSSQYKPASGG